MTPLWYIEAVISLELHGLLILIANFYFMVCIYDTLTTYLLKNIYI